MKLIIIADLFVVLVFVFLVRSSNGLQYEFESQVAFEINTLAEKPNATSSIPVRYNNETRYIYGQLYRKIMVNVYKKCLVDRSCDVRVFFKEDGTSILDDEYNN